MSSDGDDDPHSPSQFLEAPSSQSVVVEDAKPILSQPSEDSDEQRESAQSHRDSPEEEEERENRFPGPASTWRKYTHDERALVASLDQERAGDLSVHLYNTHALKSRLYDPKTAAKSKSWHSKQHWIKSNEDKSTPWHPDPNWTAWPLHTEDVPRKSEAFGQDPLMDDDVDGTLKMPLPWRAGTDLEDEVQALMLRKAKERFHRRSWTADPVSPPPLPSRSRSNSTLALTPPVAKGSRRSSIASDSQSSAAGPEADHSSTTHSSKPCIMTDDQEASRILSQSARHVLSKFDDILMALHTSRQHHVAGSFAATETVTLTKWQKRKRKRDVAADEATANPKTVSEHPGNKNTAEIVGHRDYTKHPSGSHNLNTRDWSEVLGIASLAGWDSAVVDRAAKRCATLFGEHMLFRTMPETAAGDAADSVAKYTPDMIPDLDTSDEEDVRSDDEAGRHVPAGFFCPEESCPQYGRLYEKRWMIRQHLKGSHKYGEEQLEAYDQACAPQEGKATTERSENSLEDGTCATRASDERVMAPAVDTDGFMMPISDGVVFGRGKDVQDRKRRSGNVRRLRSE